MWTRVSFLSVLHLGVKLLAEMKSGPKAGVLFGKRYVSTGPSTTGREWELAHRRHGQEALRK